MRSRTVPPSPREPPDTRQAAPMTPAESSQSRQLHSAPGAAPSQSQERDRAQQYKAFLAPRSFYHEPSLPPISPLASPPVRARLMFEDETKIEDARDSTYRQPGNRLADYVAQARPTSTSRLSFPSPPTAGGIAGKSALGKRSASGTETNTSKRGGRSAENDLEELGFSTPANVQRRRSPRIAGLASSNPSVKRSSGAVPSDRAGNTPSRSKQSRDRHRNSQRSQQKTRSPAPGSTVADANAFVGAGLDAAAPHRLFNIRKMRKPQHWMFIRLVCKDEFVTLAEKELRSEHARCAFCTKCNTEIKFEKSSTAYVTKHMGKFHTKELREAEAAEVARKKKETQVLVHKEVEDLPDRSTRQEPATAEEQARADTLATIWVAKSMRPFNILKDKYFRKYSRFLNSVEGYIKPAKPWKARENVDNIAGALRETLKDEIADECDYYTASADIWTSKSKRAFISFTLHYLTRNFDLKNWVLEIKVLPGKHDGRRIASCLETITVWWGLPKEKCVLFLRDGASNGRRACEIMDIKSMSCLAHVLHLIVGAGIVKKKSDQAAKAMLAAAKSDKDFEDALEQEACEAIDQFIAESCETSRAHLDQLRSIVDKFRKLSTFFSHSTKAMDCLRELQGNRDVLLPQSDCATRWNSTYAMLLRMIEIRSSLNAFFEYVAQTGEFSDSTAEQPTAEHWLTIRCLVVLLRPFAEATDGLGGQKYPTLVLAVPVLRSIQRSLKNDKVFDPVIRSVGDEEYKHRVETLMQTIRRIYVKLFSEKLKDKLPDELLWISALDPRSAEFKYLSRDEASLARTKLKMAVFEMAKEMSEAKEFQSRHGQISNRSTPQSSAKKDNLAWLMDVFSGGTEEYKTEELSADDEKLQEKCESELTLYMSDAHGTPVTTSPLEWWTKDRRSKFPILAALARKWLGCIATSVPSERAFSKSGNVVTSKRCSLDPETVRDVLFVGENYQEADDNLASEDSDSHDEGDDDDE